MKVLLLASLVLGVFSTGCTSREEKDLNKILQENKAIFSASASQFDLKEAYKIAALLKVKLQANRERNPKFAMKIFQAFEPLGVKAKKRLDLVNGEINQYMPGYTSVLDELNANTLKIIRSVKAKEKKSSIYTSHRFKKGQCYGQEHLNEFEKNRAWENLDVIEVIEVGKEQLKVKILYDGSANDLYFRVRGKNQNKEDMKSKASLELSWQQVDCRDVDSVRKSYAKVVDSSKRLVEYQSQANLLKTIIDVNKIL